MATRLRRILASMGVAAALTALVAAVIDTPGRHWYDVILLLPLLLSSVVSGNPHQGSEITFWIVLFLLVAAGVYVAMVVISALARERS